MLTTLFLLRYHTHTVDYGVCTAKKKGAGDAEVFIFRGKLLGPRKQRPGNLQGVVTAHPTTAPESRAEAHTTVTREEWEKHR